MEWMLWICILAGSGTGRMEESHYSPLCKEKGSRDDCNSYRGISLLSVLGKIHERNLNDKKMKITEKSVGEVHGGFRGRRECVYWIFIENDG